MSHGISGRLLLECVADDVKAAKDYHDEAHWASHDNAAMSTALLQGLDHLARAAADLDTAQRDTVEKLRSCGASWATIGGALGVSKQAAAQRYGGKRPAADPGPTLLDGLDA